MPASLEDRVRADHPLRATRALVDSALAETRPALDALYASRGRPSIAPRCCCAQLVQLLYAIPSERRLVEQLEYNLLLRWFVGLPLDQAVFHATSFTKNRERLLSAAVAEAFLAPSARRPRHTSCSPANTSRWTHPPGGGRRAQEPAARRPARGRGGAARRRTQRGRRLPRPAAAQRDARFDDRLRGQARAQEVRHGQRGIRPTAA